MGDGIMVVMVVHKARECVSGRCWWAGFGGHSDDFNKYLTLRIQQSTMLFSSKIKFNKVENTHRLLMQS
jgi:hypothetical protein